jgi:hypothetical protein
VRDEKKSEGIEKGSLGGLAKKVDGCEFCPAIFHQKPALFGLALERSNSCLIPEASR